MMLAARCLIFCPAFCSSNTAWLLWPWKDVGACKPGSRAGLWRIAQLRLCDPAHAWLCSTSSSLFPPVLLNVVIGSKSDITPSLSFTKLISCYKPLVLDLCCIQVPYFQQQVMCGDCSSVTSCWG